MGQTIRLVQIVNASRSELWRAVATAEGLARWQADQAVGIVRKGGSVRLTWPSLRAEVWLNVARTVPEASVTYRNGAATTRFDVEDGSVTLEHDGLDENDDLEGFASSWRIALAALKQATERYPDKPRSVRWFTRPVRATPEIVHLYFTEPAALASWLGGSSGVGTVGSTFSIRCDPQVVIGGTVLARVPARDVALSWEDADAAVMLRTLPSRDEVERVVAVSVSFWGPARPVAFFEPALDRLARALSAHGIA